MKAMEKILEVNGSLWWPPIGPYSEKPWSKWAKVCKQSLYIKWSIASQLTESTRAKGIHIHNLLSATPKFSKTSKNYLAATSDLNRYNVLYYLYLSYLTFLNAEIFKYLVIGFYCEWINTWYMLNITCSAWVLSQTPPSTNWVAPDEEGFIEVERRQ